MTAPLWVNRRVGGLEKLRSAVSRATLVNRHVGGLETVLGADSDEDCYSSIFTNILLC